MAAFQVFLYGRFWVITEAISQEAKRYEGRIKEGGILLSVHSDSSDWTRKAKEILERSGAQDVSSTGEASADFSKSDRPMPRAS